MRRISETQDDNLASSRAWPSESHNHEKFNAAPVDPIASLSSTSTGGSLECIPSSYNCTSVPLSYSEQNRRPIVLYKDAVTQTIESCKRLFYAFRSLYFFKAKNF